MSADKLKELRDQALRECSDDIRVALEKHGCVLIAVPAIASDGRIVARVELVMKAG